MDYIDYLFGRRNRGRLETKSTSGWNVTNTSGLNGTNEVKFTALPGGNRDNYFGAFYSLGGYGLWWSASASGTYDAWERFVDNSNGNVYRYKYGTFYGLSVRCIRD